MRVMDALRLHHKEGFHGLLVLEFPPCCRHIKTGNKWYYLSLPFQYFILTYCRSGPGFLFFPLWLSSIRLAWRRKPLEDVNGLLASSGLPMGQNFGEFCHGDFKNIPCLTIRGWATSMLDWFWCSSFYSGSTPWGMSVEQWQEWSRDDPSFIMRLGWPETTPLLKLLTDLGFKKLSEGTKLQPYRGPGHD